MLFYNAISHGKTEADIFFRLLQGEEWFKYMGNSVFRDPVAVIYYHYPGGIIIAAVSVDVVAKRVGKRL